MCGIARVASAYITCGIMPIACGIASGITPITSGITPTIWPLTFTTPYVRSAATLVRRRVFPPTKTIARTTKPGLLAATVRRSIGGRRTMLCMQPFLLLGMQNFLLLWVQNFLLPLVPLTPRRGPKRTTTPG